MDVLIYHHGLLELENNEGGYEGCVELSAVKASDMNNHPITSGAVSPIERERSPPGPLQIRLG